MKKETKTIKKDNGTYISIQTIETFPEYGFVPVRKIRPTDVGNRGKYHKGYTKTKVFRTNDPRIIKPFLYGICVLFFAIGLFMILFGNLFFGIVFSSTSIFIFIKIKKDLDEKVEEMQNKGYDLTIDTIEEKELLKKEVIGTIKEEIEDVTSSTFTKDKFKWFVKTTIPIYCVIVVIVSLLLGFLVNALLGFLIFGILIFCGLLYYFILSKIFKY